MRFVFGGVVRLLVYKIFSLFAKLLTTQRELHIEEKALEQ